MASEYISDFHRTQAACENDRVGRAISLPAIAQRRLALRMGLVLLCCFFGENGVFIGKEASK